MPDGRPDLAGRQTFLLGWAGFEGSPFLMKRIIALLTLAGTVLLSQAKEGKKLWLEFKGNEGPGSGQHIVLMSGDEEYRSEESMPMLGKILARRHGFKCTVLFSWDRKNDYLNPNNASGVRGWEKLDEADLLIIGTRMREPSAEEAAYLTKFMDAGKPIIGFRTATHAFKGKGQFGGKIPFQDWGLKILGETWVNHHGDHMRQGARAVVVEDKKTHPVLNSVAEIFGPSDVYGVKNLTDQNEILLLGEVTKTMAPDSEAVPGKKNDPMMPLAWLHEYESPAGTKGKSFCTTMGASVDFLSEDLRRLIVNASYYLLGIDVPDQADVAYVDPYYPSFYGFYNGERAKLWKKRNMQAEDVGWGKSPAYPDPPNGPEWNHRPVKKD